jgi:GTP-binding protein
LLHVVDIEPYESAESPVQAVQKISAELEKWSEELADKPRWLVLNKIDRVLDEELDAHCQTIIDELGWTNRVFKIAAINGDGTKALTFAIMEFLEEQRQTMNLIQKTKPVEFPPSENTNRD